VTACPAYRPAFESAEAFIEAFARDVGGLIAYVDREERMLFVTQRYAEWFQTTREALIGRRLEDLYSPEAYAQFGPWVKRALEGEDVHYERQAVHADGNSYWISVNLRPHRDRARRGRGIVLVRPRGEGAQAHARRARPRARGNRHAHREHAARRGRMVRGHPRQALVAAGRGDLRLAPRRGARQDLDRDRPDAPGLGRRPCASSRAS
jgi:PAS domain S-box-containing protein